jgi:arylsulfatase A-like enzyme
MRASGLGEKGELGRTLVVMTGDNGMPLPRCKANLYGCGVRVPLAMRWPGRVAAGRRLDAFASLTDLAPTFLELAGVEAPRAATGRSLVPLLGRDVPLAANRHPRPRDLLRPRGLASR